MAYTRKDHFYWRAKREGRASRAAYKFIELQRSFHIVKKGDVVLDLGAAPGGWLKEISYLIGQKGNAIGVDLLPIKISLPRECHFIQGDLKDKHTTERIREIAGSRVDAVVSDMSPNLSGIQFADAYRSYELAMLALDMCRRLLRPGGNFVVKIFPGEEFEGYVKTLKQSFRRVERIVPEATRSTSSERYLVALGFEKQ